MAKRNLDFTKPVGDRYRAAQQRIDEIEEQLIPVLQRLFRRLYPKLLELIPADVKKREDMNPEQSLEDKVEDFDHEDQEFMIDDSKTVQRLLQQALELGIGLGAAYLYSKLKHQPDVTPDSFEEALRPSHVFGTNLDALNEYSTMSSQSAAMTLEEDARLYIKNAMEKGLTSKQMAEGLKEVLGYDDAWRAERVARTESNWAVSQGITAAGEQLGVTEWGAILSADACPECVSTLDGQTFTKSQIDDIIPVHPNCRCTPDPIIADNWTLADYL